MRQAGELSTWIVSALALGPASVWAADVEGGLSEVVVTGSRIPASVVTALVPVTVLERADIERGNPTSVGRVLQALPFNTGSPLNSNVNNGGDGSERVDLRGLGPERTLVLLNGRRLPNGGIGADASVDLSSLPVSLIERIEVLTSGASAIYGADAVAGVINVITRDSFHGFEVQGSHSLTSKSDGRVTQARVLAGSGVPDKVEGMIGVDYTKQAGVTLDRRTYSSVPLQIFDQSGTPEYFGSPSTPYGPILVPKHNSLGLDPGRYRLIPGTTGHSAADYRVFTPADTFNYEPYNYAQTPNERTTAWLQGSLPLAGSVTAFVEGLWGLRKSSQQLAPTPYATNFDGAPELPDGSFGIPANNYYNPFGADLSLLRRRFVEVDDRGFSEDVRLWRTVTGVRGEAGGWHWEASAGYAASTAVTRENGLISLARLFPAIGPSGPDAAGHIVCGTPDDTGTVPSTSLIAGCVPVDLFGGPGTVTPEQVAYLEVPLRDEGRNSQRIADVNAEGTWGSLAGLPVAWAAGVTYRREAGHYRFDPLRTTGVAGTPLQADVPGGAFDAHEGYAEVRAPLLHDLPAVQILELSAGARYSDFSDFGGHPAWQGGLRWQPFTLLSLRVNYATVFRAPGIAELYQLQVPTLSDIPIDPCGNDPAPQQRANCAAHGVPGGSYVQDPTQGFATLTGGNPRLRPERGTSFDTGVDVHWAGPLAGRASLSFFRTAMKGFISEAAVSTLLEECAGENLEAACNHIARNADGTIQRVTATKQNFGRAMVRGLDLSTNVDGRTKAGRFQVGLLTTYLARRDQQPFDGAAIVHDAGSFDAGRFKAYPHWRALGHVDWQRGPWQLSYALQYIGGYTEEVLLDDGPFRHPIPTVTYHDVECGYALTSGTRLRVGVNNLTDEDPPFVDTNVAANTDVATYRLLGRTYFVDVRLQLP